MASKRQLQIAEIIKRNFGHVLQQQGSYIYEDAFVTVTKVQITPDMGQARIYLSIYNVKDKDTILEKIQKNTFALKQELAFRIKRHVRHVPNISIYQDDTLDEMYKLNEIFDKINKGRGEEE